MACKRLIAAAAAKLWVRSIGSGFAPPPPPSEEEEEDQFFAVGGCVRRERNRFVGLPTPTPASPLRRSATGLFTPTQTSALCRFDSGLTPALRLRARLPVAFRWGPNQVPWFLECHSDVHANAGQSRFLPGRRVRIDIISLSKVAPSSSVGGFLRRARI